MTQTARAAWKVLTCDHAEPYGSEKVTYDGSDDHTDKLKPGLRQVVDDQSGNNCHYDKSDDISACSPASFAGPPVKPENTGSQRVRSEDRSDN